MDTTDYKDLEIEAEDQADHRLRWGRWAIAIGTLLVLLVALLGWGLRKSIAERVLANWCQARNLICEGDFVHLGTDAAQLKHLFVKAGAHTPFEAEDVSARLKWAGFTPSVADVEISSPVLRGTLDERGLRFYGLESLASGGGGSTALPSVVISDGRVLLATSAGEIGASLELEGIFPDAGVLTLGLDPVMLDESGGAIALNEGTVEIVAENGRLEGEVLLDLQQADIRGVTIDRARLSALLDTPQNGEGDTQLVWNASLADGAWQKQTVKGAVFNGRAVLSGLPDMTPDTMLAAIRKASFEFDAAHAESGKFSGDLIHLESDLVGRDGIVSGPAAMSADNASSPQGKAGHAEFSGRLRIASTQEKSFTGDVLLASAWVSPALRDTFITPIAAPSILSAHGAELRTALDQGLQDFNLKAKTTIEGTASGWAFEAHGPAALESGSGLVFQVESREAESWLRFDSGQRTLKGKVSISGGGLPQFRSQMELEAPTNGVFLLKAEDVHLSPWSAGTKTISADLNGFDLVKDSQTLSLKSSGKIGIAGQISGFDIRTTTLSGGVSAERNQSGWQVAPESRKCIQVQSQGVRIGAVQALSFVTDVCPEGDWFVRPDSSALSGIALLGDLALPLEISSGDGHLRLMQTKVNWSSAKGFDLTALAEQISMPLTIGDNTLEIEGQSPRLRVMSRSGEQPALSAHLDQTAFGGTLVPARVTAERFSFDGTTGKGGLWGDLRADGVSIRDYRDDPLYQPLAANLTATLEGSLLEMTGPLHLEAGEYPVADSLVRLNILKLDGIAAVQSRPLTFQPGGLQPWRLSERLRGIFTDARGNWVGSAHLDITGGQITGTGDVAVSDFSFQTTRLGRVEGIEGHVQFSDLLGLTTEPDQVISIGLINPGLPLRDGEIGFQLVQGKTFSITRAAFPFAGGTLALSPFDWSLGAETQHLDVTADAIELSNLVETLKLPDAEASGTVSGSFPIDVEGTQILVRDASLKADSEGGHIAYKGSAGESAGQADPSAKMAFAALKDFEFTVLELGLSGNVADRMTISLLLEGISRNGIPYGKDGQTLTGQPFQFNIQVTSALQELFRNARSYTSQNYLTDIVVKEVQENRQNEAE